MDEQFLSPLEVAEILQVKKNTVYEMIKRGDLKATKMGKQFRIARKDVYEYMGVMPETESPENIVICGQDQLLDVLCALYNSQSDGHTQVYRSPMGSYSGLYRMYQNENYVATCHMWDGATDTYNLPYIERMLPGEQVAVFHLLKRMINREKGSGIRIFIDEMCKKLDIDPDRIHGYEDIASSHLIAATNVLRGTADVAIGNEKSARQMEGIQFLPLKQESYDIVFRKKDLKRKEFQNLLNIIGSEEFQKEAEMMSGYDISDMGKQLY